MLGTKFTHTIDGMTKGSLNSTPSHFTNYVLCVAHIGLLVDAAKIRLAIKTESGVAQALRKLTTMVNPTHMCYAVLSAIFSRFHAKARCLCTTDMTAQSYGRPCPDHTLQFVFAAK
jgi:hypothetical protein